MADMSLAVFLFTAIMGILYLVGDLKTMAAKNAAQAARDAAQRRSTVVRLARAPRTDYSRNDFIPYEFREAA
ncbi:MAG: hypothetical protein H7841_05685 [Magnetospirillum sp. WYHS-4]